MRVYVWNGGNATSDVPGASRTPLAHSLSHLAWSPTMPYDSTLTLCPPDAQYARRPFTRRMLVEVPRTLDLCHVHERAVWLSVVSRRAH